MPLATDYRYVDQSSCTKGSLVLCNCLVFIWQNKFLIYISRVTFIDVWFLEWHQSQWASKNISIRETLQKQEFQTRLQCLKERVTNILSLFLFLKNHVFHDLYPPRIILSWEHSKNVSKIYPKEVALIIFKTFSLFQSQTGKWKYSHMSFEIYIFPRDLPVVIFRKLGKDDKLATFCHCDKIPEIVTKNERRFLLVHGYKSFRPRSSGSLIWALR